MHSVDAKREEFPGLDGKKASEATDLEETKE